MFCFLHCPRVPEVRSFAGDYAVSPKIRALDGLKTGNRWVAALPSFRQRASLLYVHSSGPGDNLLSQPYGKKGAAFKRSNEIWSCVR